MEFLDRLQELFELQLPFWELVWRAALVYFAVLVFLRIIPRRMAGEVTGAGVRGVGTGRGRADSVTGHAWLRPASRALLVAGFGRKRGAWRMSRQVLGFNNSRSGGTGAPVETDPSNLIGLIPA